MSRARTIIAMLIALLLLAGAAAAGAEVYVNKEKPEDWEERPILRITALSFTQNDAFVLECGGHVMILDGGSVLRARDLKYYLQKNGLGHVDIIFNSHQDTVVHGDLRFIDDDIIAVRPVRNLADLRGKRVIQAVVNDLGVVRDQFIIICI